jgi:tRNA-specific 2-thiouridylase
MALAQRYGFIDYSQPAGGCCFLTDKNYSAKLVDLWQAQGHKNYELDDVMLLKVGRHIRPEKNFKLIVAREEGEGRFLQGYQKEFISMISSSHLGPLVLIDGTPSAEDLYLAARITARYGQGREADQVDVDIIGKDGLQRSVRVAPMAPDAMPKEWFI